MVTDPRTQSPSPQVLPRGFPTTSTAALAYLQISISISLPTRNPGMTSISDVAAVTYQLQQLQMASAPKMTESPLNDYPSFETCEGIIEFIDVPLIPTDTDSDTKLLVPALSFRLEAGQNCVVIDKHKSKKAALFRILDTFLPVKGGKVVTPKSNQIYRINHTPYFPSTSNLREQLIYPHSIQQAKARGFDDKKLLDLLGLFNLEYLITDTFFNARGWLLVTDWKKRLTASERQRIAFVRMLYHQPQFAILDDCLKPLLQHGEKNKKNIEVSKHWVETFFNKAAENHTTLITALSIGTSDFSNSTNLSGIISKQEVWHSIIHRHARLLNFNSDRSFDRDDITISRDNNVGDALFGYHHDDIEGYSFGPFPGVPADKQRSFTLANALKAFAERENPDSTFNNHHDKLSSLPPLHDIIATRSHEAAAREPETETYESLRIIKKANRPSAMALGRRLSERLPMKSPASNPELIINFHAHQAVVGSQSPKNASPTTPTTPPVANNTPRKMVGLGVTVNAATIANNTSSLRTPTASFGGYTKAEASSDGSEDSDTTVFNTTTPITTPKSIDTKSTAPSTKTSTKIGDLQSKFLLGNSKATSSGSGHGLERGHKRIVSKASSQHSSCSSNSSSSTATAATTTVIATSPPTFGSQYSTPKKINNQISTKANTAATTVTETKSPATVTKVATKKMSKSLLMYLDAISQKQSEPKTVIRGSKSCYPLTPPMSGGSSGGRSANSPASSFPIRPLLKKTTAPQATTATSQTTVTIVTSTITTSSAPTTATATTTAGSATSKITAAIRNTPPTTTILTPTEAAEAMSAQRSRRFSRDSISSSGSRSSNTTSVGGNISAQHSSNSSDAESNREVINGGGTSDINPDFLAATATASLPKPSFAKKYSRTPRNRGDHDNNSRSYSARRNPHSLLSGQGGVTVRKSFSRLKPQAIATTTTAAGGGETAQISEAQQQQV
ncbi:ATP-binding cassette long-chain fatty acid transporter pxa2 [Mycoemilia scoparia]|uniref:ATP-binding cassette long-chain fatty acid transporter pxa2 n=1 Tax=Mycoemilia scoparia TaxID=417184 RepID=A0A9W8DMN7_9FUNG|nr:ATP-binding cassette long-chain fatty acid transporter pxa2 [Mycoemilia scoparia]